MARGRFGDEHLRSWAVTPKGLRGRPLRHAAIGRDRLGRPAARRWAAAVLVVGLIAWPPRAALAGQAALAIGPGSTSLISARSGTRMINWTFTPTVPLIVTHLGWVDARQFDEEGADWGDGLSSPHTLGIWVWQDDAVGGPPLVAATIPSGHEAQLIDRFRYVTIEPLPLIAGTTYVIGGETTVVEGISPDWSIHNPLPTVHSLLDFGMRWHHPADGFEPPDLEGADFNRAIAANFRFVPEPSTLLLLALGGAMVLAARRRSVRA